MISYDCFDLASLSFTHHRDLTMMLSLLPDVDVDVLVSRSVDQRILNLLLGSTPAFELVRLGLSTASSASRTGDWQMKGDES